MTNLIANRIVIFISSNGVVCIESKGKQFLRNITGVTLSELKNKFNNSYETVEVYIVNFDFTIIPEELFLPDKNKELLEFTNKVNEPSTFRNSIKLPFNVYAVWAVSNKLEQSITTLFPNAMFYHISEKALSIIFSSKNNSLIIELNDFIVSANKADSKLQILTVNQAKTLEDKVYFSLLPFQSNNTIDPESSFIGTAVLGEELKNYISLQVDDSNWNYTELIN